MAGGGSGGGGTTTTSSSASYPEEFKPLAEAAVNQILDLQEDLPLSTFSASAPKGTAGLSSYTKTGMELGALTPLTTTTEKNLASLGEPIADVTGKLTDIAVPTPASKSAISVLEEDLGLEPGSAAFTSEWTEPATVRIPGGKGGASAYDETAFPTLAADIFTGLGPYLTGLGQYTSTTTSPNFAIPPIGTETASTVGTVEGTPIKTLPALEEVSVPTYTGATTASTLPGLTSTDNTVPASTAATTVPAAEAAPTTTTYAGTSIPVVSLTDLSGAPVSPGQGGYDAYGNYYPPVNTTTAATDNSFPSGL